jgi:hypothetical protein
MVVDLYKSKRMHLESDQVPMTCEIVAAGDQMDSWSSMYLTKILPRVVQGFFTNGMRAHAYGIHTCFYKYIKSTVSASFTSARSPNDLLEGADIISSKCWRRWGWKRQVGGVASYEPPRQFAFLQPRL